MSLGVTLYSHHVRQFQSWPPLHLVPEMISSQDGIELTLSLPRGPEIVSDPFCGWSRGSG